MKHIRVYEPNRQLKMGAGIWIEMVQELIEFRELIGRLFIRDFVAQYKQSVLGNAWNLIMPFVAIGTFMYLQRAGVFIIGPVDMPYPLYALIGLTFWQVFAGGLNAGTNSLTGAGDLITKINFPREVLVIASMAQCVLDFLIKFALIIVFFFIFQFVPSWKIIFLPLVVLPLMVFTLALALLLSLLNSVLRDTANIVTLSVMFLMFLTPVLYPIPNTPQLFSQINILSIFINVPRDLIAFGAIKDPAGFAVASTLSVILFLMAWRIFHLVETRIPERI